MSTHFTSLNTSEGLVHVLTKTRWLGFIPLPHTSVMPHDAAALTSLGTFIKWSTDDTTALATLHQAVVALVKQNGAPGLVTIARMVKDTACVASTVGGDWHEIIKQAVHDGIDFPVPEDVLSHVKSFR